MGPTTTLRVQFGRRDGERNRCPEFVQRIGERPPANTPALSTSPLLDELPERRPMTVVFVSGAWRQFCCATA